MSEDSRLNLIDGLLADDPEYITHYQRNGSFKMAIDMLVDSYLPALVYGMAHTAREEDAKMNRLTEELLRARRPFVSDGDWIKAQESAEQPPFMPPIPTNPLRGG